MATLGPYFAASANACAVAGAGIGRETMGPRRARAPGPARISAGSVEPARSVPASGSRRRTRGRHLRAMLRDALEDERRGLRKSARFGELRQDVQQPARIAESALAERSVRDRAHVADVGAALLEHVAHAVEQERVERRRHSAASPVRRPRAPESTSSPSVDRDRAGQLRQIEQDREPGPAPRAAARTDRASRSAARPPRTCR